ncbi:MAG: magnesium transporter [Sphingobacteriales bacterium]|jgi:magnesium transporter
MKLQEEYKQDVALIKNCLEDGGEGLAQILDEFHASEIAVILEEFKEQDRVFIVNRLPAAVASEVISEMDEELHPEKMLETLNPGLVDEIIAELDSDDAADLISQLSDEKRDDILDKMEDEDAENLKRLLAYKDDSAGGLMDTSFVQVPLSFTKRQAIKEIITRSEEVDNVYTIFAVDEDGRLSGTFSLQALLKAKANSIIEELIDEDLIYVDVDTDQEEVARLISQYNLPGIPVVDNAMVPLGRITFDDVMDVLEEESTEDILRLSGVSDMEELRGSWLAAVKSRLPWLLVNLFTAFLASGVVLYYKESISKMVVLAVFMPIIAGLGGNAATQALAVTIRRISLSTLSRNQIYRVILKEVLVGLFNGLIIGILITIIALLTNEDPNLGLVVFLAMTGNLFIAGLTGSSIPIILEKLGVDPAVASSIIITAFTDIIGFLLLLGLASSLLL